VKGVVTFDGQPLEGATVIFVPSGEVASTAAGPTDAQGRFELTTRSPGDGVMPGDYRVTITKKEIPMRPEPNKEGIVDAKSAREYVKQVQAFQSGGKVKYITPIDYADQNKTPFKSVKVPGGNYQFDLTSGYKYNRS
jgi:hypothetical protein